MTRYIDVNDLSYLVSQKGLHLGAKGAFLVGIAQIHWRAVL